MIQIEVTPFQELTTVLPRESSKLRRQRVKSQCQRLHRIDTADRIHDGLSESGKPKRASPVLRFVVLLLDRRGCRKHTRGRRAKSVNVLPIRNVIEPLNALLVISDKTGPIQVTVVPEP